MASWPQCEHLHLNCSEGLIVILVKDENDRQKSEMDKYHVGEYMNMARPGNINKMMSNAQPKMPNMNVSIPTVQTKL